MAKPIHFIEQNASFMPKVGPPYPIWVRDYVLGSTPTVESISCWEFDSSEQDEVLDTGMVYIRFFNVQPIISLYNARITDFEGKSADYTHKDCFPLPAYRERTMFAGRPAVSITCAWQLDSVGLKFLRESGFVVFRIVGDQRDVEIFGNHPSIE